MAFNTKNFLDIVGLGKYDELIKDYIRDEDDKQISILQLSADGNYLNAWKDQDADPSTDNPDYHLALGGGDLADMITALAAIVPATYNSSTKTYSITGLSTTATNTLVAAINEIDGHADTNAAAIGTLGSLSTTTKTDLVSAINEVFTKIGTDIGTAIGALDYTVAAGTGKALTGFEIADGQLVNNSVTTVTLANVATSGAAVDVSVTDTTGNFEGTNVEAVLAEIQGNIDTLDGSLATVAKTGDADDVAYDNATSGLAATDVQAAIDEVVSGLGTAAAADVATSAITEGSTDDDLVSAAQVATFVATEIAGLEGAMHFVGVITRQAGETDAQAIARVVTDPEAGDTVVMSDNGKEYIYDGTAWREVGDETEFVKKTTTIAGVDLEDNITKTELLTALNVEDGAEVNIIESVKVNGSALTPDANRAVNVTVAEGATNGTVAVNGTDVAVHGLGSAAYTASTAYDAAGTAASAIAALDASITNTATGSTDSYGNVPVAASISITEVDGIITSVGEADADPFGAAAGAYEAIGSISNAAIEALFSSEEE